MNSVNNEISFPRGKSVNQTLVNKQFKDKNRKLNTNKSRNYTESDEQLFKVRKRKGNDKNELKSNKSKRMKTKNRDNSEEHNEKVIIESMSLSRLPEGITIYGCIQEISDFDIKISISGGIVVKVMITNISDSYTQLLESFAQNEESFMSSGMEVLKPNGMFKSGQYFPIKILNKSISDKGFANIEIMGSLNPRDVYSDIMAEHLLKIPHMPVVAAVQSVEDHGFVMDIGVKGVKAFLSKDKAQNAIQLFKGRKSLFVGQLVLCAIESVANERSITLTTKVKTLAKFKLTSDKEVSLSCLTPGITVTATVMNVNERGLELNILNDFSGFVTRNHLKTDWDLPKNMYTIGDRIEGTVLYIHPVTKQISLTLKPKMEPKMVESFLQNVKIGSIFENAVLMGRDDFGNSVFKLPNNIKAIATKKHLFEKSFNEVDDFDVENKFAIGSTHKCRVKSINLMDSTVGLTLRQSLLESETVSADDLQIGSIIKGTVKKVVKSGVCVQIGFGLIGLVPNIHLAEASQITNREQLFPNGKVVKCRVTKIDKSSSPYKVSLTCKKSLLSKKLDILSSYESAKPGFKTDGVVALVHKKGLLIEFFNGVKGFIPIKYLSTYRIEYPEKVFKMGQIVKCSVVSTIVQNERMTCSLINIKDKKSKLNKVADLSSNNSILDSNQSDSEDKNPKRKKTRGERNEEVLRQKEESLMDTGRKPETVDLKIGSIIKGTVKKVVKNGVYVQIGFGLIGLVPNIHLAEAPEITNREQLFPNGKIVKCRVTKIDKSSSPSIVSLTCKKSLLSKKLEILSSYESAKPGFKTDGIVVLIHEKGLLIEFFNGVKGFIPIKYLSTESIEDPEKMFKMGQIVKCTVVSVIVEKKRMTCSLINIKDKKIKHNKNEEMSTNNSILESKKTKKEFLHINESFRWDVEEATPNLNSLDLITAKDSETDSDSDQSDSEDNNPKRKKTRRERNEEVRQREELLRKKEESLMDTGRKPETVDDFEISVLASPNSSLVWLKYMAFHLEQAEIPKARAVGERALNTISFREEQEKLNVWVALLNLENLYGTQSSLDQLFERALQYNEPIVIYNHLANIYLQSNKLELTEALYHIMLKKFKQNKDVWINFGLYYMKNNRAESARKLMQKSLKCLDKRDHIDLISKFAQMEFKLGDVEHGKTLFENVLSNFPKRIDLWSVYIDMMVKYALKKDNKESEDSVRNIFERVITFKLAAKKMKFIFKRYIDFESQFDNEDLIDRIKQKALEYVEGKHLS